MKRPKRRYITNPQISELASSLNSWLDTKEFPVKIDGLFRFRPDIRFEPTNIKNSWQGYATKGLDDSWKISYDRKLPFVERRFVIAHEFCHVYFEQQMCESRRSMSLRQARSVFEEEANQLALEFFMPTNLFKKAWSEHGGDIEAVADLAQMPAYAVRWRARDVRIEVEKVVISGLVVSFSFSSPQQRGRFAIHSSTAIVMS